jgi:hypothetical protein
MPMRPGSGTSLKVVALAVASIGFARAIGHRATEGRCLSVTRSMLLSNGQASLRLGNVLGANAPGGRWESDAATQDGTRLIRYVGSMGGTERTWEWSCDDRRALPLVRAVSPDARQLTPELAPSP